MAMQLDLGSALNRALEATVRTILYRPASNIKGRRFALIGGV
jgi:hypothetical protein